MPDGQSGAAIQYPRLTNFQKHRITIPHSSTPKFNIRSIYIPMLVAVITDLKILFSGDLLSACDLPYLLEKNIL